MKKVNYLEHMVLNLKVVLRSIRMKMPMMAFFHFLHAMLPFKITSHEWWRIKGRRRNE